MLGPRIASAVVLIPLVLFLLWAGPETTLLAVVIGVVIGTYEFYDIASRSPYHFKPAWAVGYVASIGFAVVAYLREPIFFVAIAALLAVLSLLYLVIIKSVSLVVNTGISVFAPLYVALPLSLIVLLRSSKPNDEAIWWIVLICVATWSADTGGYTFGRLFGKHKLAPSISPKKTVEGAIGGILVAMLGVALVGGLALNVPLYWTLPLGMILAIVSIIGDLFESWIKRRFDVKDSGKLIPGHGGLLDRVDSLLAVALVAYVFIFFYS